MDSYILPQFTGDGPGDCINCAESRGGHFEQHFVGLVSRLTSQCYIVQSVYSIPMKDQLKGVLELTLRSFVATMPRPAPGIRLGATPFIWMPFSLAHARSSLYSAISSQLSTSRVRCFRACVSSTSRQILWDPPTSECGKKKHAISEKGKLIIREFC